MVLTKVTGRSLLETLREMVLKGSPKLTQDTSGTRKAGNEAGSYRDPELWRDMRPPKLTRILSGREIQAVQRRGASDFDLTEIPATLLSRYLYVLRSVLFLK